MRRLVKITSLRVLLPLGCIVGALALRAEAQSIYCGVYARPPRVSGLDCPLRPYFVPRRPACGGHDYRYRVEVADPCSCTACGEFANEVDQAAGFPYPAELGEEFAPVEFERLGQIPNDSLLEAVPPGR
jgi:hypothetical protein